MASGIRADSGRSYSGIEEVVGRVRAVLGIGPTEALPSVAFFELLNRYKVAGPTHREIPLTYAVRPFPTGVEGVTSYDEELEKLVVTLSEASYELLEAGFPRARFALAHEVGHAVLHAAELVRLAEIPHGDMGLYRKKNGGHDWCYDTEWQANSFGAALLMPAAGLAAMEARGLLTAEALQLRFGVSAQAADIRLDVFRRKRTELI